MADVDRVQLPPESSSSGNNQIESNGNQRSNSEAAAASGNSNIPNLGAQRPKILTGNLPDDFLRIDGQAVNAQPWPQQQMYPGAAGFFPTYYQKGGLLIVTIAQARLAKNYGLSRMDPYCRVRVANTVFETPTAYNGSKNPRWNKRFQIPLPDGANQMYIELYDECSFSPDERIAWGLVVIKDEVIAGEVLDDWYSLSGKQGDDKEGMINIILEYKETPVPAAAPAPMFMQPVPMMAYGQPMAYAYPPGFVPPMVGVQSTRQPAFQPQQLQQQQQQQQQTLRDEDVKKVKDMFPDMDDEIIRSVLLSTEGNVDAAVNHLLSMTAS